jgi:NDP-sugar pyrophosphorylase family protein
MAIKGDTATMEVIIPCAGASTRFPDTRPKYLLGDYKSKLMIEYVIDQYVDLYPVHVVILKQHDIQYDVQKTLHEIYGDKVNVIVLNEQTSGPAETIYQAIHANNISGSILIRDCDSFFSHEMNSDSNCVYVAALSDYPTVRNPASKSFVIPNSQNIISTIVEKKIVSDYFCVGGYQFKNSLDFLNAFDKISHVKSETFVSDCIEYLISDGKVFNSILITDWVDVGTKHDWLKFNNRPTIFCDIDGTLIENQNSYGKNNYFTDPVPLPENVKAIHLAIANGCQIIFTTARREKYRERTTKVLDNLGFKDYQLIMNLNHAKRIVINDYAPTNPYPSAVSINLQRNAENLAEILNSILYG